MIFTIKERLILLQILPTQGSLSEMVDVMDLAKQLKLSDDEKKNVDYKESADGRITWKTDNEPNKEFNLTNDQITLLKKVITDLDKQHKININMVDLAIKIQKI